MRILFVNLKELTNPFILLITSKGVVGGNMQSYKRTVRPSSESGQTQQRECFLPWAVYFAIVQVGRHSNPGVVAPDQNVNGARLDKARNTGESWGTCSSPEGIVRFSSKDYRICTLKCPVQFSQLCLHSGSPFSYSSWRCNVSGLKAFEAWRLSSPSLWRHIFTDRHNNIMSICEDIHRCLSVKIFTDMSSQRSSYYYDIYIDIL